MFTKISRRQALISATIWAAAFASACSTTLQECKDAGCSGAEPDPEGQAGDSSSSSSGTGGTDVSRQPTDDSAGTAGTDGEPDTDDDQPQAGAGNTASSGGSGGLGIETGTAGHGGSGEGGTTSAPEGGAGGEPAVPHVDITGPQVIAFTPTTGTKGVDEDAVITVTFDEPMDELYTQAAFESAELGEYVSFDWNTESTVLTITPFAPLAYASGDDDVAAQAYTAAIATTARDLAGNPLQAKASTTFTTLRRVQRTVESNHVYVVYNGGSVIDQLAAASCLALTGDFSSNNYGWTFVRFDLTQLPEDIHTLESAVLSLSLQVPKGDPYAWSDLLVDHYYEASYSPSSLTALGLADLGFIADGAEDTGWQSLDVTDAVVDDLAQGAAREHTSGYRLGFSKFTDKDGVQDYVAIDCDPLPKLDVEYTRP
jgi:hypothetical protein